MTDKIDKLVYALFKRMGADQSLGLLVATEYIQMIPANMVTLHWDCLYLLAIYTARCSIATSAMPT